MARLLLELIVLVLLVSLVSCQVITSHSKSGDDSTSASSITLGSSDNPELNVPSSTSTSASESASSTNSDSSLDSDSSLSSEQPSSSSSSNWNSDSYDLPDKYPFPDYFDENPLENGCAFLTEYYIGTDFDHQMLDILKQIPTLTNCSNVDNSLASFQIFSNIIRNLCPTNETAMSKSMFRQVESFLFNNFGKEMYNDALKENCRHLFDASTVLLARFSYDIKVFTGEATDFF